MAGSDVEGDHDACPMSPRKKRCGSRTRWEILQNRGGDISAEKLLLFLSHFTGSMSIKCGFCCQRTCHITLGLAASAVAKCAASPFT